METGGVGGSACQCDDNAKVAKKTAKKCMQSRRQQMKGAELF